MANTQQARITVGVVDQLGTPATIALYALIDPVTTVTELAAMKDATVTALKAVLGAGVRDSSVTLDFVEDDAADAGSRVEQTAVLDYIVTSTGRQHGIALAGWLNGLVGDGGAPTLTGTVGLAVTAALTGTVPGGATGVWTNNAYQPLGALHDAFLSFRKRRRALSRSSEELAPAP